MSGNTTIAIQQKNKGDTFCKQAEVELSKKSWFATSREKKYEDVNELYQNAGNAYKVGGYYYEAGDAYTKAALLLKDQLQNPFEASKAFQNAGSNYKKVAPERAVVSFQSAILLMTDAGRVLQAAKLSKECAELYESEGEAMDTDDTKSHVVLALEAYEQAADLFTAEDANSQASQCWVKVAELCSAALDPPDMIRAARLYEDIGRTCLDSNLLKFNAKGYFLQAILCHLANNDIVAAQQAKGRYEALDYTFSTAREGTFTSQLIDCVQGMDPDAFSTACYEYDRVSKLDPWKTTMLVKIKRTIDDDNGGNADDDDDDIDLT